MSDREIVIPIDEYRTLCAVEGRLLALAGYMQEHTVISKTDVLNIIGVEQSEDEDGEQDGY